MEVLIELFNQQPILKLTQLLTALITLYLLIQYGRKLK